MDELKDTIAKNLVHLRTQAHYTQLQLAEMLNYSDKAVSKWERGEAIPDIRVIIQLASIYNITVDEIVKPMQGKAVVKPKINQLQKHILITLLSVGLVWFIATGLFVIMRYIAVTSANAYTIFYVAAVVSSIILTVFSALWGNRLTNAIASSLIVWTSVILVHGFVEAFGRLDQWYLLYAAALVFEILIVLWFIFRKVK